jgi:hypothetical protein
VKEFGISMYEKIYENSKRPMTTRGDNEIFTKEENVNDIEAIIKYNENGQKISSAFI